MLTLLITVLFFAVFGKMLVFALKVGWGIFKIAAYLIFLPALILVLVFGGLLYLAVPVLIIAGIIGAVAKAH
ncbi:MAG: hypothetical protein K6F34_00695 [Lachnospiraceae bacterium]|nr:hypothetical protein [Lachnospiraceae bacterium]